MNITQIYQALAHEFGKGIVKFKKTKDSKRPVALWFKADKPSKRVIAKAKRIVNNFVAIKFYDAEASWS